MLKVGGAGGAGQQQDGVQAGGTGRRPIAGEVVQWAQHHALRAGACSKLVVPTYIMLSWLNQRDL